MADRSTIGSGKVLRFIEKTPVKTVKSEKGLKEKVTKRKKMWKYFPTCT